MKQFLEFIPILVFAGVYFLRDIYWATGALMAAVSLQMLVMLVARTPINAQLKLTFWVSMVAGGLTLVYQSSAFILWKPTIVNWLMASVLVGGLAFARVNLLEKLLGAQLPLPSKAWLHLTLGWSAGFCLAGVLNLIVAYNFSEAFWVSYKLVGGFLITLSYIIATVVYLLAGGYLQEPAAVETRTDGNSDSGNPA